MASELLRLRWHARWTSVWALLATFGCLGAASVLVQDQRPAMVWDHRHATLSEALDVVQRSEHAGHRMNALFVIRRELLRSVDVLRSLRQGIDPTMAHSILLDLHKETANR